MVSFLKKLHLANSDSSFCQFRFPNSSCFVCFMCMVKIFDCYHVEIVFFPQSFRVCVHCAFFLPVSYFLRNSLFFVSVKNKISILLPLPLKKYTFSHLYYIFPLTIKLNWTTTFSYSPVGINYVFIAFIPGQCLLINFLLFNWFWIIFVWF